MLNSIQQHYECLNQSLLLLSSHVDYLKSLKKSGFEPKVIYDIGACVLQWTKAVESLWPNAEIVLFEANPHCEFLYSKYRYHIGVLSHTSNINVKFYLNEFFPHGASYYREIGSEESAILFPENKYYNIKTVTLDDIVTSKNYPLPDLVKIDVQGAEKDVLQGGKKTLEFTQHLILELPKPNMQYNENAPSATETMELASDMGFRCAAPLFSDNGKFDGDYGFTK